jgi:hypothetical protein
MSSNTCVNGGHVTECCAAFRCQFSASLFLLLSHVEVVRSIIAAPLFNDKHLIYVYMYLHTVLCAATTAAATPAAAAAVTVNRL